MNRVALVEDNPEDRKRFEEVFADFCARNQCPLELDLYEKGEDFLKGFDKQYDLLFMDIELPDSNGIDICKKVRETDERVVIVFLTNMGQYAIKGYEVNAIDFLLKPLDVGVFLIKMKKILSAVKSNQASDVKLVLNGGKCVIRSGDIVFAEVSQHEMTFHTIHGAFAERYAMRDLEKLLSKTHFSRPNYCYLVNLEYVLSIQKFDLTLRTGEVLQISRNRRKEFIDDFSRYLGGSL
ncbi:MAG: response regulator transcription factor [Bacilli bacterium]|nr:response regulator transcription factor [Bacilli bacterium]